jgi:hypothetical protein
MLQKAYYYNYFHHGKTKAISKEIISKFMPKLRYLTSRTEEEKYGWAKLSEALDEYVDEYKLIKSAFLFDIIEICGISKDFLFMMLKINNILIPEDKKIGKNERYMKFKDKGWARIRAKEKTYRPILKESQRKYI